jgi:hypothetical protein
LSPCDSTFSYRSPAASAALIIGLFLTGNFEGQLVIPDFGFYGRDAHVSLMRVERLIAGVNSLDELLTKLRKAVLLITDKTGSGTTYEDAVALATYARLLPGTHGFSGFIGRMMA